MDGDEIFQIFIRGIRGRLENVTRVFREIQKLLMSVEDLDPSSAWAFPKKGSKLVLENWRDWIDHEFINKLSAAVTRLQLFDQLGDAEDLGKAEEVFSEAERSLESRELFKQFLEGEKVMPSVDAIRFLKILSPEAGVLESKPLRRIELNFYFLRHVFFENPNASRNRGIFIQKISEIRTYFEKIHQYIQDVREQYESKFLKKKQFLPHQSLIIQHFFLDPKREKAMIKLK